MVTVCVIESSFMVCVLVGSLEYYSMVEGHLFGRDLLLDAILAQRHPGSSLRLQLAPPPSTTHTVPQCFLRIRSLASHAGRTQGHPFRLRLPKPNGRFSRGEWIRLRDYPGRPCW